MLNSHRQTSTPTSAIRPATTAVATPPDHSIRASTLGLARCGGGYAGRSGAYARLSGLLGSIGMVMISQALHQARHVIRSVRAVLTQRLDSKHARAACAAPQGRAGVDQDPARMTSRVRGPCTPWTRSSSMSLVAEGPLIQVQGRPGSRRARACGTIPTIWLACRMHR